MLGQRLGGDSSGGDPPPPPVEKTTTQYELLEERRGWIDQKIQSSAAVAGHLGCTEPIANPACEHVLSTSPGVMKKNAFKRTDLPIHHDPIVPPDRITFDSEGSTANESQAPFRLKSVSEKLPVEVGHAAHSKSIHGIIDVPERAAYGITQVVIEVLIRIKGEHPGRITTASHRELPLIGHVGPITMHDFDSVFPAVLDGSIRRTRIDDQHSFGEILRRGERCRKTPHAVHAGVAHGQPRNGRGWR